MSLQAPDGSIVVVEEVNKKKVVIRIHKDEEHRDRYKTQTETEWETTRQEHENVEVDLETNADSDKSVKDNNITRGYEAIKTLDKYSEYLDLI